MYLGSLPHVATKQCSLEFTVPCFDFEICRCASDRGSRLKSHGETPLTGGLLPCGKANVLITIGGQSVGGLTARDQWLVLAVPVAEMLLNVTLVH